MDELRHKDVWNGTYHNIRFEIVKWKLGDNPNWNYYIYLPVDQIPVEFHKFFFLDGKREKLSPDGNEYLDYNCGETSYISDLDWHGGITFYEKELEGDGKLLGVKLGCDYAHYFDEEAGYPYNLEWVLSDTKHTIDKLHELIPNLKVSCRWDGKFRDVSECFELPNGGYVANCNKEKWERK